MATAKKSRIFAAIHGQNCTGGFAPCFVLYRNMMLKEEIIPLVEEALPDDSLFVVELIVSEKGKPKVSIFLDGDNGVSVDQCAAVSRTVGQMIEEREIITSVYHLEVSSPGVDQPLTIFRQFPKHIGRRLDIEMNTGENVIGLLKQIEENQLVVDKEIKEKKKKVVVEECKIPFEEIKQALVVIAF